MATILRRLGRRPGEDGFSVLEVVVAMGVMLGVLTLLAQNLTAGFSSVALGRNREVATGIANQVLEQTRALPFDDLVMGNADLASSVAGADTAISVEGAGAAAVYRFRGRAIPRAEVTGPAPLVPHRVTTRPSRSLTNYTRSVYVTAAPDANPMARLVTVRVAWSPAGSTTNPMVEVETLVFAQTCEAQSGPRPCESYWYAKGDSRGGTIRVHGAIAGQPDVDLSVSLGNRTSQAVTEQLTAVQSSGTAAALALRVGALAPQSAGGGTTSAAADDDVTSALPVYEAPTPSGPAAAASLDAHGAHDAATTATLAARLGGGSTAGAAAAAAAAGQVPPMGGGALDADDLAHGRATVTQGGAAQVTLALASLLGGLGDASLLDVAAAGTTGTAEADRDAGPDPATTADDVNTATVERSLGTTRLLGLPGLALPGTGWNGHLLQLSGWTATASAEAGPGAAADPAASQSGVLSYWNGAGYTSVDLATDEVDADVSAAASVLGCTVTVSGDVRGGGHAVEHEHQGGAETAPVQKSRASVAPPVVANFAYRVTCAGIVLADLTIDVDLGSTLAEARYAVPDA